MVQKAWVYITVKPNTKVKIDKEDLEKVSKHSWRVTKGTTGRPRVVTSIRTEEGVKTVTLGRFLMKVSPSKQVYPRRFNEGLDYRKSNLIACTLKERQRLLPKKKSKTSSSFRGVSFSKATKKWRAGIEINGKSVNLGDYKTEMLAALAYNEGARKYFGDMAYQNPVGRRKVLRHD